MTIKKFKVCPKCGTHNDTDARFCLKCGTSLSEVEITVDLKGVNIIDTSSNPADKKLLVTTGEVPKDFVIHASIEALGAGINYTEAWKNAFDNLEEVLKVRNLDGIANYRAILSPFQLSENENKVAFIIYGDGVVRRDGGQK